MRRRAAHLRSRAKSSRAARPGRRRLGLQAALRLLERASCNRAGSDKTGVHLALMDYWDHFRSVRPA